MLASRYEIKSFGFARILQYLGIIGGVLVLGGLLGLIGAMSGSLAFGSIILLAVSAGAFILGFRLASNQQHRYPYSSKAVLTVAALTYVAALVLITQLFELEEDNAAFMVGLLWAPLVFFLAYRYQHSFLLAIALLGAFHWVGTWTKMFGRSTYAMAIQDPRIMTAFSVFVILAGLWHLSKKNSFGEVAYRVYGSIGLLYLNTSLLILSIWDHPQLLYVLLSFAASLIQLCLGAWLHKSLFTGYGVTFFIIYIFTRYHEHFWDRMSLGAYFLVGGLALIGLGYIAERGLAVLSRRGNES